MTTRDDDHQQLIQLLGRSLRVIDIGPFDQALLTQLQGSGVNTYLGFVEEPCLASVRAAGPNPDRIHSFQDDTLIAHCSTDLLILRAGFTGLLWSVHDQVGARYIAAQRHRTAGAIDGMVAGAMARLTKRTIYCGTVRLADEQFDLFEVRQPRGPQTRMYFSPAWGPTGLAAHLAAADIKYVVLRWFEQLPVIDRGEDLDVLVSDTDLAKFRALVESEPGTQPLDLYSESGLPSSDYHGAAYYPPVLARMILENAHLHESGFLVPAPIEHLRSLAYHAVYHKGLHSGIPSELRAVHLDPEIETEHDYVAHLARLAATTNTELDITLEGVDRYLTSVGWRPPNDALRRLTNVNSLVPTLLNEPSPRVALPERAELSVFLIRERTLDVVTIDEVRRLLDRFGFDVIYVEELDVIKVPRDSLLLRGGNWGAGPYPVSGGLPVIIIVAVHHNPIQPWSELEVQYPHLTNAAIYEFKEELRRQIKERVVPHATFNPVHSSDNTAEALEYLNIVVPDLVPELFRDAITRTSEFSAPDNVVRTLNLGRRSRVDVVAKPDGYVVRKTFAPSFGRFLQREILGRRALSTATLAVSPLVAAGDNWIEVPLHGSPVIRPNSQRPLPLPVVREMVAILREVHSAGYDVVDAKPANFLRDSDGSMRLVDLEFLYEYDWKRPDFADSANFRGPWPGFDGDIPVGDLSYEFRWRRATGLPLEVLISGSPCRQRIHRSIWAIRLLTVLPGAPARQALGRLRGLARNQKRRVRTVLTKWARLRMTAVASDHANRQEYRRPDEQD